MIFLAKGQRAVASDQVLWHLRMANHAQRCSLTVGIISFVPVTWKIWSINRSTNRLQLQWSIYRGHIRRQRTCAAYSLICIPFLLINTNTRSYSNTILCNQKLVSQSVTNSDNNTAWLYAADRDIYYKRF